MDKMGRGRECHHRKTVDSHYRKVSEGSPSVFQKNAGVEKVFALPEEDITIFCQVVARFPVDSFKSHSTECFVGAPFNVSEKFGYRTILSMMGWYHVFPSNFFSI